LGDIMKSDDSGYLSIIGFNFMHPIVMLLEELEKKGPRSPGEVQAGAFDNGFSTAIIGLVVFLIESYISRTKYILHQDHGIEVKRGALEFFKDNFKAPEIARKLEELLVVRDVIAHNHAWGAQITWDEQGLRFVGEPEHPGSPLYGDPKFRSVIEPETRKTKTLGMNLFPTRISYQDAIIALKSAYEILIFLENEEHRFCPVSHESIQYHGETMTFSDFIRKLDKPNDIPGKGDDTDDDIARREA
jgi:hypothetical protein